MRWRGSGRRWLASWLERCGGDCARTQPLCLHGIKQTLGRTCSLDLEGSAPQHRCMIFSRTLVLSLAIGISLGMPSCASSRSGDLAGARVPEKAFVHHGLKIKAWKSPEIDESVAEPTEELHMLVSGPGWQPKRWVKLRQGESFEGLTFESQATQGSGLETPNGGLVPLLIQDYSIKIESGVPKRYLILRDFCGEAVSPFYSDEAKPPFKHSSH